MKRVIIFILAGIMLFILLILTVELIIPAIQNQSKQSKQDTNFTQPASPDSSNQATYQTSETRFAKQGKCANNLPVTRTELIEDVNNDQVADTIKTTSLLADNNDSSVGYVLHVNEAQYRRDSIEADAGFFIIDLQKNDNIKEIVVREVEPSGYVYALYQYVNSKLIYLDNFICIQYPVTGDGTFSTLGFEGFWLSDRVHQLDSVSHTITEIKAVAYNVNIRATANKPFNLYANTQGEKVANIIQAGESVYILSSDLVVSTSCNQKSVYPCVWYKVKDAKQNEGFVSLGQIAHDLDGLVWAN